MESAIGREPDTNAVLVQARGEGLSSKEAGVQVDEVRVDAAGGVGVGSLHVPDGG